MAILSTSTSGHFTIFYRNLKKKETAVILKPIDQLSQNVARVYNLVRFSDRSHEKFKFFLLSIVPLFSIVCLLSTFCSKFDTPLEVQDVH